VRTRNEEKPRLPLQLPEQIATGRIHAAASKQRKQDDRAGLSSLGAELRSAEKSARARA
jgi:hypothetical protein